MFKIEELAKMIDHSLLHPTMTKADLVVGMEIAKKYEVASVCIKPYAVADAVAYLRNTGVLVGTVIGFPHGSSTIQSKHAETEQACKEGAHEIDMVVNIGKVLEGDWQYVEEEMAIILDCCRSHGAVLKVIFENDFLPDDTTKIMLCSICGDLEVDFVKTSTGYGFCKNEAGFYSYEGATEHDLRLMRKNSPPTVAIKAAGGVRTLQDLLRVREFGVTRVGATATSVILEAARKHLGLPALSKIAKVDTPTTDY